jgi:hypothetical protein
MRLSGFLKIIMEMTRIADLIESFLSMGVYAPLYTAAALVIKQSSGKLSVAWCVNGCVRARALRLQSTDNPFAKAEAHLK